MPRKKSPARRAPARDKAAPPPMAPRQVMFSERQRETIDAAAARLAESGQVQASAAALIREGAFRLARSILDGTPTGPFLTYTADGR